MENILKELPEFCKTLEADFIQPGFVAYSELEDWLKEKLVEFENKIKDEVISYIGYNQGWEETGDIYRKHFGLKEKFKKFEFTKEGIEKRQKAQEKFNQQLIKSGYVFVENDKRCNQCKKEGNYGVCDRKDCSLYKDTSMLESPFTSDNF